MSFRVIVAARVVGSDAFGLAGGWAGCCAGSRNAHNKAKRVVMATSADRRRASWIGAVGSSDHQREIPRSGHTGRPKNRLTPRDRREPIPFVPGRWWKQF